MYPGKVVKVAVKEGDAVAEGTVLVQLDDGPDRIHLSRLEAEKDDALGLQMAQARLDQKRSVLERLERAVARSAASPAELDEARLEARLAELRALSHAERFSRKTNVVVAIEDAIEECLRVIRRRSISPSGATGTSVSLTYQSYSAW